MDNRTLDAFMAEKVMEWKANRYGDGSVRHWMYGDGTGHAATGNWSPSTNIAAAWEVVKKLNRDGWMVVVCASHDGNHAACMIVRGIAAPYGPQDIFLHLHTHEEDHKAYPDRFAAPVRIAAETEELAICLAARQTVEAEAPV